MFSQKSFLLFIFYYLELVVISSTQLIPYRTKQIFYYQNVIQMKDIIKTNSLQNSFNDYKIENLLSVESIWNLNNTQILHFILENFELKIKSNDNDYDNEFIIQSATEEILQKIRYFRQNEFYIILQNDLITKIFLKSSNDISLMNFQKGIASLFQFHFINDSITHEQDILGHCNVIYRASITTKYRKYKRICTNWYLIQHLREEKPLDLNIDSSQEILYTLNEIQNLLHIESIEKHRINIAAKNDVGNIIESITKLDLISSSVEEIEQINADNLEDALKNIVKDFDEVNLEGEIDGSINAKSSKLKMLIKSAHSNLTDDKIGTQEMASTLLKLLPIARNTNKKELLQILKAHSTQDIRYALLDLLAMTQTDDSHQAIMEILNINNDEDFNQLERYFQTLSIGTRPNIKTIKNLYNMITSKKNSIKNSKLYDTILQTLASNCAKYSKLTKNYYNETIIKEFRNFIIFQLKLCETFDCSDKFIRSLQNLRDPSTIINLFDIALNDQIIGNSIAAMKALKLFPIQLFNEKFHINLKNIFYQRTKKYDSTVRIAALDIILEMEPKKDELENLLEYLISNDKAFEIKTYVIQKLTMISDKNPKFASIIKEILQEKPKINNYHVQAQKGVTTALFRRLSKYPAFNETLYSCQETYKGVLKQGTVDIVIGAEKEEFSVFRLGLFTRGLYSFIGDSSSNTIENNDDDNNNNEENENPTAGMEIAIQEIQLRPLIFFSTQSELMGHIWSGTASDPTPAYQATTLLHDHESYLILQNGMTIFIRVYGAQSINLNGQITFSLWNRNGHVEINRNSGIAIDGSIKLSSSFINEQNDFLILNEPKLNLIVDCDFYTDVNMCLQLNQPESKMKYHIFKKRTIFNGTTDEIESKKLINLSYKLLGNTLALNRKNNQMCNKIFFY